MADATSTFGAGRGLALARAAEAMLRALGGVEVQIRFAGSGTDNGNARLGLATYATEDVNFAPVTARSIARDDKRLEFEFCFAASPVLEQVETRQCGTAAQLFETALGIVHQDKLLRVNTFETDFYAGAPYLFRVTACE